MGRLIKMTNLLFETLAGNPERSQTVIQQLSPDAIHDRLQVIDTISKLTDEFVLPATSLLTPVGESGGQGFDLQQIADSDFADLILGVLAQRFRALQPPPPDSVLAPVLDDLGFEIHDPSRREQFFRAWMAQRALHIIRRLLKLIEREAGEAKVNQQELALLKHLEQQPLPALEKQLVSQAISFRSNS